MRYNTYRQYKTLTGVKKQTKLEIIKHLQRFSKNLIKFLPKDVFQKYIKDRPKYEYVFRVNRNNQIEAAYFYLYKMNGPLLEIDKRIDIQLPMNCTFNYIYDEDLLNRSRLHVQFISEDVHPDNIVVINVLTGERTETRDFFGDTIGNFSWDSQIYTTSGVIDGDRYSILIPPDLDYALIYYDVTELDYDTIPPIPLTVLE